MIDLFNPATSLLLSITVFTVIIINNLACSYEKSFIASACRTFMASVVFSLIVIFFYSLMKIIWN